MRPLAFVLVMLCVTSNVSAQMLPPIADAPDYIVTLIEKGQHLERTGTIVVSHHAGWTRTQRFEGPYGPSDLYSNNRSTEVHVFGAGTYVLISHRSQPPSAPNPEARNTGKQHSVLGETCTVWEELRRGLKIAPTPNSIDLTCVTDDGIELWHRSIHDGAEVASREATRIQRRSVAAAAVKPPITLSDAWEQTDSVSDLHETTPDHELVMERLEKIDSETLVRRIRHHRSWTYVEDKASDAVRRLAVKHRSGAVHLEYTSDSTGRKSLVIAKAPPGTKIEPISTRLNDLNHSETIANEHCRWFNVIPDSPGARRHECYTDDGIMLKEMSWTSTWARTWTAVSVARRPIGLDEVKPPLALFDPKFWELE